MRKNKPSPLVRLNKYLADSGIVSRRKADELINEGKVRVNGKVVTELGVRVDPRTDQVLVGNKLARPEQNRVYIMFHKPQGILTSMDDPEGRPTVRDFFQKKVRQRLFPVGRLDWDTEGLLLLTNDGEFANEVMHPRKEITKTYMAKLNGQPSDEQLRRLIKGVTIPGGKAHAVHVERIRQGSEQYDWVQIVITEGRNRQVRHMFAKIGFDVKRLKRVAIGQLRLGSLRKGEFVELTSQQLMRIFASRRAPERAESASEKRGAQGERPQRSGRPGQRPGQRPRRPG